MWAAPVVPKMSRLSLDTRCLVAASIAPNTAKAYTAAAALVAFETWLNGQVPNDPLLAKYLAECHVASVSIVGLIATRTLAGIRREG